MDLSYQL